MNQQKLFIDVDELDNLAGNSLDIAETLLIDGVADGESLETTLYAEYEIDITTEQADSLHSYIHSAMTEAIILWCKHEKQRNEPIEEAKSDVSE